MRIINSIVGILLGSLSYFIVEKTFIAIMINLFELFPILNNFQGSIVILLVVFLEIVLAFIILSFINHSALKEIRISYLLTIMSILCLVVSIGYIYYNCINMLTVMVYAEIVLVHTCMLIYALKYLRAFINKSG